MLILLLLGSACTPAARGGPGPLAGPGERPVEPGFEGGELTGEEGDLPPDELEAAPEPDFILDPKTKPDWLGLATGFGLYRGIPAVISIGSAKAEGEVSMARLVSRRRARDGLHRMGERVATYLGRKARLDSNAILLLQAQMGVTLDGLLPDQRRFVPLWEDQANQRIYSAILIPLDRFLGTIRDSSDFPDAIRRILVEQHDQVRSDLLEGNSGR